ncbi:MAG: alcohol dehydrogenase catalytic domain-containing protein [Planctomycetota bacterium]
MKSQESDDSAARVARAAVMTEAGSDLQLQEFPRPAAPLRGLLVRVACCTICRSDLHTWKGRRPGPTPAILGHEIVGVVAELGEGVSQDSAGQPLAVGNRVTWTLHSCCGGCRACVDWRLPMKCELLRKYGHDACDHPPHLRGGFAEHCVVDRGTGVIKLPDSLADHVAAPANCAAATAVAGLDAAGFKSGQSLLILGAGAVGCYAAAFAKMTGARQVIAADRLAAAQRFGADGVIDSSDTATVADEVRAATGVD